MKLKKLHINSFRHLEDLKFDFTYPEDFHIVEKRGKPLDKICIIGQSATGKTGLLELIFNEISYIQLIYTINNKLDNFSDEKNIRKFIHLDGEISVEIEEELLNKISNRIDYKSNEYVENNSSSGSLAKLIEKYYPLYYLKSNLISEQNCSILNESPLSLNEQYRDKIDNIEDYIFRKYANIMAFDDNVDKNIWFSIVNSFIKYKIEFSNKVAELLNEKGLAADFKKFEKEYKNWEKNNINPLLYFAQKFNPIIDKLGLEIDMTNQSYSIPIKNKRTEEIISIHDISTGTKGLLLSFLPLYQLNTQDSIILIDEPERSLYPDIQMELVGFYQKLAPEAQFVVATHSPFVAASFEPCERFILYFDEDGKVAVRRGVSPVGDDPNDIIYEDFGVNYYNKDYQEKFKHYLELLDKSKNEENKELKKKLILEASKLGNIYNFNLNEEDRKTQ